MRTQSDRIGVYHGQVNQYLPQENVTMLRPPQPDEHAPYYGQYIQLVPPDADFFALFAAQSAGLSALLQSVAEAAAEQAPAPGEWSIKQVLGHINDTERVFAYRALRFARGDSTPIPGYDHELFMAGTDFNHRSLRDLLAEFAAQRQANVLCFQPLTEAEIDRRGTASNNPFSVRALLYVLAGHVIHHSISLRDVYKVAG
jgi:uncharacterized damage-inducible protein DinB